jgi:hypothetical protein
MYVVYRQVQVQIKKKENLKKKGGGCDDGAWGVGRWRVRVRDGDRRWVQHPESGSGSLVCDMCARAHVCVCVCCVCEM